jgi:hypothetical protein
MFSILAFAVEKVNNKVATKIRTERGKVTCVEMVTDRRKEDNKARFTRKEEKINRKRK